ncbi:MAG: DUF111 family protein [Phyllobacteriaceae bacterium]|nr:DUF111 family protein [Phyllobacteriaceae bacterium]
MALPSIDEPFGSELVTGSRAWRLADTIHGDEVFDRLIGSSSGDGVGCVARAVSERIAAAGRVLPPEETAAGVVAIAAIDSILRHDAAIDYVVGDIPIASVAAPGVAAILTGLRLVDAPGRPLGLLDAAVLAELAARGDRTVGGGLLIGSGVGVDRVGGHEIAVTALVLEGADHADEVVVIEFEIDDMTGEEIGTAAERLRAVDGVLDLSLGQRIGKKHRPSTDFRLLVRPAARAAVERACFLETSTIGLRHRLERRSRLERRAATVRIGDVGVPVKIVLRPNGDETTKVESDAIAHHTNLAARRSAKLVAEKGDDGCRGVDAE